MNNTTNQIDYVGIILISTLLLSLAYAGFLTYKSIDWTVLKRLESQPLILPAPASGSAIIQIPPASPSATVAPRGFGPQ